MDAVLDRVGTSLRTHLERGSVVRKRRSVGARTDRGTWVRVERRGLDRIGPQGWNGTECAAFLDGVAQPEWHGCVMAALVYFKKISEDSTAVRYLFGEDPEEMTRQLTMEPQDCKAKPDDGDVDYTFLKASRKINAMHEESSQWPERGMSVS